MKLLAVSPNGKMLQIGDNTKTAFWYNLGGSSLGDIKVGDEIDFVSIKKNGASFIEKINKAGSTAPKKTEPKEEPKKPVVKEEVKVETVIEEPVKIEVKKEDKIIKKVNIDKEEIKTRFPQAWDVEEKLQICKIVSETLIAIGGVTDKNVDALIDQLFKKYSEHIY